MLYRGNLVAKGWVPLKHEAIKFYLAFFLASWIIPAVIVLGELRYVIGIEWSLPLLLNAGATFVLPAMASLIVMVTIEWAYHRNARK
jgi:hypothetical protein